MKRIIITLVLMFSIYGFSQDEKKEPVIYKDFKNIEITKDGLINTTQVITLDNLSAKEIYTRLNIYIQKNYTNPNAVAKGAVENEFISFNGIKSNCVVNKIMFTKFFYSLEYYYSIDIKDGKIKLTLTKAILREDPKQGYTAHDIDCFTYGASYTFNDAGEPRSLYKNIILGFNENINQITNDLISSIKDSKKSDW